MSDQIIELDGKQYIKLDTLAAALGTSEKTLLRWGRKLGFPIIRVGQLRIAMESEVRQWLHAHKGIE